MYSYFRTTQDETPPNPKQCQSNVKGKYKERVVNVCLFFTYRIFHKRTENIKWQDKNRSQNRVWVESSGSQTRVLFAKSTLFPKLIRTWFEQDSNKCIKKHKKNRVKKKQIDSENSQMMLTKRSQGLLTSCSGVVILLVGFKA